MTDLGGANPAVRAKPEQRSPIAQAASRRNGARSKGPRTRAGKDRSSQNALKHGFRAQRTLPGELPDWLAQIEREILALVDHAGPDPIQYLDRVLLGCFRLREIDAMIAATLVQAVEEGDETVAAADPFAGHTVREIKVLLACRRRFRGMRDRALRKLFPKQEKRTR